MTIHETAIHAQYLAEALDLVVIRYTRLYEDAPESEVADDVAVMTDELAKVARTARFLAKQLALKAKGSIR